MWTWHLRPKAQVQIIEFAHNHQTLKELPPLRSPSHKSSFAFLLYLLLSIFACLAVHHSLISLITSLSSPLTFFFFFLSEYYCLTSQIVFDLPSERSLNRMEECLSQSFLFFPEATSVSCTLNTGCLLLRLTFLFVFWGYVNMFATCEMDTRARRGVNNLFLRETSLLW